MKRAWLASRGLRPWLHSAMLGLSMASAVACATNTGDEGAQGADAIGTGTDDEQVRYIEDNGLKENYLWFRDTPFAGAGIPMLLFRLFPEIAPDIWGDTVEDLPQLGLPRNDMRFGAFGAPAALPLGMGFHRSYKAILPAFIDITSFQVVGITCGGCHMGKLSMPNGELRAVIGAPNTQFDPHKFGEAVFQTVNRPEFNAERFRDLVKRRIVNPNWEFNDPKLAAQQVLEATIFLTKKVDDPEGNKVPLSELMVKTLKDSVNAKNKQLDTILGKHYDGHAPNFHGGTTGQADALGKIAAVSGSEPQTAAPVDLPSVWRQDTREYAQYDGTIRNPFFRNLAAEVGVSGVNKPDLNDPEAWRHINTVSAWMSADLIMKLPSPKYPFGVRSANAGKGGQLYGQYCKSCHGLPNEGAKTVRVGLDVDRGADEQRARQLRLTEVNAIAKVLKAACDHGTRVDIRDRLARTPEITVPTEACNIEFTGPNGILGTTAFEKEDGTLNETVTKPGYVAQPLAGVWATAPYLHNGSVPNLRALLDPSLRPAKFWRGSTHYDQRNVGWVTESRDEAVPTASEYDTSLTGNSNGGHASPEMLGGYDWHANPQDLEDLLEFLKSL